MHGVCVSLQSKGEGKTTTAATTAAERAATPTDKKDKPRSERKRVSKIKMCNGKYSYEENVFGSISSLVYI